MSQGDGDRMTREYFELLDKVLKSRNLSGRKVSDHIDCSPPFYSRVKKRQDLDKSWEIVEKGLGVSPRTLFAVLTDDVRYDEMLAVFGPQDEPQQPDLVAEFGKLADVIAVSPGCRHGEVAAATWSRLEDLEGRRFKDAGAVEVECCAVVLDTLAKDQLRRDEAVLAVGALGIWCTVRRHFNDRGSATRGLVPAIRVSVVLAVKKLSARLLQRATYLLCDVDQFRSAELAAERAVRLYADLGDIEGLGMSLIDTGFVAFGVRELEKAESRLLLGAGMLGNSTLNHISKASAFHLAARACSIRGDLQTACQRLDEAEMYATSYKQHWAAIRWCAGNIQFQLGQSDEAERALQEALQVFVRADKVTNIVMILLDLATILVAQDRFDEVPPLAEYLRPYLDRLSERDQTRSHIEDAHACLVRARHVQALRRFRRELRKAWRSQFTTP